MMRLEGRTSLTYMQGIHDSVEIYPRTWYRGESGDVGGWDGEDDESILVLSTGCHRIRRCVVLPPSRHEHIGYESRLDFGHVIDGTNDTTNDIFCASSCVTACLRATVILAVHVTAMSHRFCTLPGLLDCPKGA